MKAIFAILFGILFFSFNNPYSTIDKSNNDVDVSGESNEEKWKTLQVQNIGEISYPSSRLEIQNEELKALNDSIRSILVIPALPTKLTLQQIGLNSGTNFSYCRVLVEEIKGKPGDFLESNIKLKSLSNDDRQIVAKIYKNSVVNSFKKLGIEIKKWHPVELKEINGSFCVYLKYERESTVNKSDVVVNLYCFPNNKNEVDITMSCRIEEFTSWSTDFSKIINSFTLKINNN